MSIKLVTLVLLMTCELIISVKLVIMYHTLVCFKLHDFSCPFHMIFSAICMSKNLDSDLQAMSIFSVYHKLVTVTATSP